MTNIDTVYLRKLVATEQMDGEAISVLIDEYERLRAQVADLTRIAGCVAVADAVEVPVKTFDDIKRELKTIASIPRANFTHYWAGLCDENGNYSKKDNKDA